MSGKPFCLVMYFIPEDKDDQKILNAFAIPKYQGEVTLSDIEEMFPLEGEYIFRFKYSHEGEVVFLDITNKTAKVPLYNKNIVMKVTRKQSKEEAKAPEPPKEEVKNEEMFFF